MAENDMYDGMGNLDDLWGHPPGPPLKKPCRATASWVGSLATQAVPRWSPHRQALPLAQQQLWAPPGTLQQPSCAAPAPALEPPAPPAVAAPGWFQESTYLSQAAIPPQAPAANSSPLEGDVYRQDSLPFLGPDWLAELGFLDETFSSATSWAGLTNGAGDGTAESLLPPAALLSARTEAALPAGSPASSEEQVAGCGAACSCQDCELLAQVRSEWQGPDPAGDHVGLEPGSALLSNLRSGAETGSGPASSFDTGLGLGTGRSGGDSWRVGLGAGDSEVVRFEGQAEERSEPEASTSSGRGPLAGLGMLFEDEVRSESGGASMPGLDEGSGVEIGSGGGGMGGTGAVMDKSRKRSESRQRSREEQKPSSQSPMAGEQQGCGLALSTGLPFFRRDDSLARRLAEAVGEAYTPPPEAAVLPVPKQPTADRSARLVKGKRGQVAQSQALVANQVPASETPLGKQLIAFAEAVATDDANRARFLMKRLKEEADVHGECMQRVAFYFLEGLWARTLGTGLQRYAMNQLTPAQELSDALVEINKQLPFVEFLATISTATFIEAVEGESQIHILDLGIWHFNHWPRFMRSLVDRPGPRPSLRITKLQLPAPGYSVYKIPPIDYVEYKQTLVRVAASLGIPFEYQALQMNLESLTVNAIHMRPGEALLVYGAMRFHTLSDGSIIRSSPRDAALRTIRALEPKIFLLGEKQVDHNGPFFLHRFSQALDYYSTIFESIDHHMPRGSVPRQQFEKNLLGRDIVNVVACEGLQRVSRCEPLDKWRSRMKEAGFVQRPLKPRVKTQMWETLEGFDSNWGVHEDKGALMLTWKGKPLMATSTWRIAC